jgi:hypothetical protein
MGGLAGHHAVDVGPVETDVAQQVIVELQKVTVGTALFRTAEKHAEDVGHFHVVLIYGGSKGRGDAHRRRAYAARPMNFQ